MNKAQLEEFIDSRLDGFEKRRAVWVRIVTQGGVAQAVELQKSAWGGQFYLNVCLTVVDREELPAIAAFDVRARAEQISGREAIQSALNLERRMRLANR